MTVAILVSTTGEGATWHLELGEKPRPMPLAAGRGDVNGCGSEVVNRMNRSLHRFCLFCLPLVVL